MADYKWGDKVIICQGRLKGEAVTVIGETNLNMYHRIVVRRSKGRVKIMGIPPKHLRKLRQKEKNERQR